MGKEIKLANGVVVKGATLLTTEEAEKLPEEARAIGEPWWLRSPGSNSYFAVSVRPNGFVDYGGFSVNYYDAVRPALELSNLESSNLQIGDRFRFGEKEFEIISADRALCTESIGKCAFREDWLPEDANNYETSDIKKFVDDWYKGIAAPESETTVTHLYTLEEFLAIIHDIPSSSVRNCESASELAELVKNVIDNGGKDDE